MRNNDVIQSIRYMMDVNDAKIAEILKLSGYRATREEIAAIFDDQDGEGPDASHELTAHFLDGLIYYKRGKSDKHPPQPIQIPVTNNIVLKKLRVAFKLREDEIQKILESAGFSINAPELNALFRKEDHKNYRPCGDQILRYFLKGMTIRLRGDENAAG
ncbi:MAG: DUF1456 family protein [Balneolaceae bacterium]|nr:MAG: DUF1456 family protein [Balneolaceae bacterium]